MSDTSIAFSNSFTPKIEEYIKECSKKNTTPTVKEFGLHIGTSDVVLWAWANKKKKNDKGDLTEELARPKFRAALTKLDKLNKNEKIESTEKKINPKQELFCQLYTTDRDFFGNGVLTYAEAYDLDISIPKNYNTARSNAYKLLTNAYILKRIDELLELGPLNDTYVDRQLAKVITQDADFGSKVAAIREYNKLKTRIAEKLDLTTGGEPLAQVVGFQVVTPESNGKDNSTN